MRRLAPELKVAVVYGDDILDRIDELLANGHEMRNMDTGEPLPKSAKTFLALMSTRAHSRVAEALATGADVVITGRCADPALALAPMIREFGWKPDDVNLLASGIVAGHIIECGPQCSGGNCQVDWQSIPDLANIGYPIVEIEADGTFAVTKHPGTGGRVNTAVVKEQLLYEIGDPRRYITPDVVGTSRRFASKTMDLIAYGSAGFRGSPRTTTLKASIAYHWGWKAVGTLVFSYPNAVAKARAADAIVRTRLQALSVSYDEIYSEFFGFNACHGPAAPPVEETSIPEVQLRIGVRSKSKADVDRFTRELIPLVLGGPPGATGYGDGRPAVREIVAFWPALVPREIIESRIEVFE